MLRERRAVHDRDRYDEQDPKFFQIDKYHSSIHWPIQTIMHNFQQFGLLVFVEGMLQQLSLIHI